MCGWTTEREPKRLRNCHKRTKGKTRHSIFSVSRQKSCCSLAHSGENACGLNNIMVQDITAFLFVLIQKAGNRTLLPWVEAHFHRWRKSSLRCNNTARQRSVVVQLKHERVHLFHGKRTYHFSFVVSFNLLKSLKSSIISHVSETETYSVEFFF